MAKEKYKYLPVAEDSNEINLREILDKYKRFWPWFLIITTIFLSLAVFYIKKAPNQYTSIASIIINDEKGNGTSRTTNGFDVDLLSGGLSSNSMANEMGLLRSKRLMLNTVKALDLNIQYFNDEDLVPRPLYYNSPIKVEILRLDEEKLKRAINNENNTFKVKYLGENGLQLLNETEETILKTDFNSHIQLSFVDFVIKSNIIDTSYTANWKEVTIKFLSARSVAAAYKKKLEVELIDDKATLITLKLTDGVAKRSEDILNQLIFEYNREAIEDKNLIAKSTADFIDERLSIINSELDSVESGKESFKELNRLTDIGTESSIMIQNISEYNKEQQQVATQLEVTSSMLNYIESGSNDLLPANLGLESETNAFVTNYNDLILKRDKLLSGSTNKNPLVVSLNEQIDQLKSNVKQSLLNQRQNLIIQRESLRKRTGSIGSQIARMPGQERQVRGIERQQSIKEALYLFLLQKREENTLELSVTGPKAKIVDSASSSGGSISPSPKIILGSAVILGLLLPFLVIRSRELLNNKIKSREDLEKLTKNLTILGELPLLRKKEDELIKKDDRSVLAESFRILAANLQFLISSRKKSDKGVSIFVTSTIKGEGKTFIATNMAITLALSGKKVVLVGADLRNPQLQRYQKKLHKALGVSDYLVNREHKLSSYIQKTEIHENLAVLPSGTIPPNPAELLHSDRLGNLFSELKQDYDYIVVDTAPALLVADTFLINMYADLTLYVTKADFTEKKLMEFSKDAVQKGKLKNISFVLNGVAPRHLGYGSKYGYVYGK
ncbi:GumC family protein [Hyunsoonleella pacifica]|uniref:non-specific protein-tyrosine kinase n=1 Tax=Hyunsoonleella pacifica TaxID=1080224 RepID=A0A4Q9FRK5_9FLAO|nr:polysaccharide biosynthesis tyrosine autokinase [Hyunsoonleella pacifica]TBN18654.1 polysaccharide biosynthesis tyrosine autokinase [Hyunsoonleella pacifica]GGD03576.1 tyrosine protein kinase [Hyunsoonleella pacifica]